MNDKDLKKEGIPVPAAEEPAPEAAAAPAEEYTAPAEPEAPAEDKTAEAVPAAGETPAEEAPTEETPAGEVPVEEAPAEEAPAGETPAEEAPAEETPAGEVPVEEAPAEEAPAGEAPVEEAPAEEAPAEEETPVDLEITRNISLVMKEKEEAPAKKPLEEPVPVKKNLDEFDFTGAAEKAINAELDDPRDKEKKKRRPGRFVRVAQSVTAFLLLCFMVGLGAMLYGLTYHYDGIYPGVRLWDVSLAQLGYDQARDAIQQTFDANPLEGTMNIHIEDQVLTVSVQDASAHYDLEQTLAAAWKVGRTGSMRQRLWDIYSAMSVGVKLLPDILYDAGTLGAAIDQIVAPVERELCQPTYEIQGESVKLDRGQTGVYVDSQKLTDLVYSKMQNLDFTDVTFAAEKTAPDLLDLLIIKKEIDKPAVEPMLDLKTDRTGKTLAAGQVGYNFDLDKAQAILDKSTDRVVTLPIDRIYPMVSDEDYLSVLFRDELVVYTSEYNESNEGRTTNVTLASKFCNGVILNPFDTFSYNKAVGPRTYERGFKDATVYNNGTTEDGVGGGICQVSSSIYAAVLRTDLLVTERRNHTYSVTYVPLGEDATVVYGSQDFCFINTYEYPVKLEVTCEGGIMTVRILGTQTKLPEERPVVEIVNETLSKTPFQIIYKLDTSLRPGTETVKNNGYNAYVVDSWRVEKDPLTGEELKKEYLGRSRYSVMNKTILYNPIDPNNDPHAPAQPAQ